MKTVHLLATLADKIRNEATELGIPDWAYVALLRTTALGTGKLAELAEGLKVQHGDKMLRKSRGRPKKII